MTAHTDKYHSEDPPSSTSSDTGADRMVAEMAELVGGLAHELRNPLSTMMINLKLLAEDLRDAVEDDATRRALLKVENLTHEAQRLQRLFDEFLSLTGTYRLQTSPTDINDLIVKLAEFVAPTGTANAIVFRLQLDEGTPSCPADGGLLRQALLNLVINAQQAMPKGGELLIVTRNLDHSVEISVSDSGLGIADEDKDRILRPFYSTKAGGTGLGLSVSQRIIHEHGGTLSFESTRGRGTTFVIVLPKTPGPGEQGNT